MPTVVGYAYEDNTSDINIDVPHYTQTMYVQYNEATGLWDWSTNPFDKPKEAEIIWEV